MILLAPADPYFSVCSSFYSYSSGGEDGYVRVHHFDPDYFTFKMDA